MEDALFTQDPALVLDGKYELITEIGKGGQGFVYKVQDLTTAELWAAKVTKPELNRPSKSTAHLLQREREAMATIPAHPNIVKSEDIKVVGPGEKGVSYHLMELASNETLLRFFKAKSSYFSEEVAQFYFLQICHAVEHIHLSGYAHLDLKLNNIFLDQWYNIKIGDFGSAYRTTEGRCRHRRGTQNYMAPEVRDLSGRKTFDARKADVYSLGVILFVLLFKSFPRRSTSSSTPFTIPDLIWNSKSRTVRNLLVRMLDTNPKARPTIEEVCGDEWLLELAPGIETTCFNLMEGIRRELPDKPNTLASYPYKTESTGSSEP
jgi:serine/threonine protein kinase